MDIFFKVNGNMGGCSTQGTLDDPGGTYLGA